MFDVHLLKRFLGLFLEIYRINNNPVGVFHFSNIFITIHLFTFKFSKPNCKVCKLAHTLCKPSSITRSYLILSNVLSSSNVSFSFGSQVVCILLLEIEYFYLHQRFI